MLLELLTQKYIFMTGFSKSYKIFKPGVIDVKFWEFWAQDSDFDSRQG